MRQARAALLGLLLLVAASSRSSQPAATPVPAIGPSATLSSAPTEIERMLGFVPESFHDKVIWFGDRGRALRLTKLEGVTSQEAVLALSEEERQRFVQIVGGVAFSRFSGGSATIMWQETFGYGPLAVSREVWSSRPPWGFSVMEGNFDEALIVSRLKGLGYKEKEHNGTIYYSHLGDYEVDFTSPVTRLALAQMNRVAVEGYTIIAAPADKIFFTVLDTWQGKARSLRDIPAYLALAHSMGDLVSAAILPRSEALKPGDALWDPRSYYKFAKGWGRLHDYQLVGLGYRTDGEERAMVIALFYGDPLAAAADAQELKKRLEDYIVFTALPQRKDTPLMNFCQATEPQVIRWKQSSALAVECKFRADAPNLWSFMVEFRDLLFLVPDPSELE